MEWHIYIDGASSCNPGHAGAGLVAYDEFGNEVGRDSTYLGEMTNNMAEYEALVKALTKALKSGVKNVSVYSDSLLVVNQVLGKYKIKNITLQKYAAEVKNLICTFDHFAVQYIPREKNKLADKLAKEAIKKKG
jgi:ribonuclease HI